MISVRLLNYIGLKAAPDRRRFEMPYRSGLTAREIVRSEGLSEAKAQVVLINGRPEGLDTRLTDGDEVAISAMIGGG